ncbi:hypothetical protein DRO51_00635 [Candidatus Bathyarchaeota archaeon]|nr:MAG: hypothetical protein DRO51_00635 [Candidatus Bathyarchaeota archaeon]
MKRREKVIVRNVRKKAEKYEKIGGCSQSVLLALQEEFNVGCLESFKAATALSGGVARYGETCGALLGALMFLGIIYGREKIEDYETYVKVVELSGSIREKFMKELEEEFGFREKLKTTLCRDIQKRIFGRSFNLRDPEEYQAFIDSGAHTRKGCVKVCGIAAKVAAEKALEILSRKRFS